MHSVPLSNSGGVAIADTHGPDFGMMDGSDATDPPAGMVGFTVYVHTPHTHTCTHAHTHAHVERGPAVLAADLHSHEWQRRDLRITVQ